MRNVSRPWCLLVMACAAITASADAASSLQISKAESDRIGRKLWQNECGGSVEGLTAWNAGEDFASLGIGHFIWYPRSRTGPFHESFPDLLRYLEAQGIALPGWLRETDGCPWANRAAFLADFQGPRLRELRRLLATTVGEQTGFAVERMRLALPAMLQAAPPASAPAIRARFEALSRTPQGQYALVDYVNFKGEGTSPTERYGGQGWGLLQVLEGMEDGDPTPAAFSHAAERVLVQRVRRSPPERGEGRWLPGWRNRVRSYAGG